MMSGNFSQQVPRTAKLVVASQPARTSRRLANELLDADFVGKQKRRTAIAELNQEHPPTEIDDLTKHDRLIFEVAHSITIAYRPLQRAISSFYRFYAFY
jgi:hypothetical protein